MNKRLLILIAVVLVLGLVWTGWNFLKNRGGSGEDTTTPGGEEETSGSAECPTTGYWRAGGIEYRLTGYETHSLGGSSQRLCCGIWEDSEEDQKMKYCYDAGGGDSYIAWTANAETGGQYVKTMEGYKQGDQDCFKFYDTQGNVATEGCQ
jgi:hypothetical protein